ncbi:hypothetical protein CCYA_CCYA18G4595 [Cyanidiococcus yangmingshanensis]|nr:hypothetical protein CCYA_CCYA18G4595 [Cyanidiococcus yangmingshanensis]
MDLDECQHELEDASSDEDFFLLGSAAALPDPSTDEEQERSSVGVGGSFPGASPNGARLAPSAASLERRRRRSRRLWARYGPAWSPGELDEPREAHSPMQASVRPEGSKPSRKHEEALLCGEHSVNDCSNEAAFSERGKLSQRYPEEVTPSLEQLLRRRRLPITGGKVFDRVTTQSASQPGPSELLQDDSDDEVILVAEYPADHSKAEVQLSQPAIHAPVETRANVKVAGSRRHRPRRDVALWRSRQGQTFSQTMTGQPTPDASTRAEFIASNQGSINAKEPFSAASRAVQEQRRRKAESSSHTKSARPSQTTRDAVPTLGASETSDHHFPIPITITMQGLSKPARFTAFPYTILDEIFATFARMHGFDWLEDPLQFYRETDSTPIQRGTRAIDLALRPGEVIRATLSGDTPSASSFWVASQAMNVSVRHTSSSSFSNSATWLRIRYCGTEEPRRYPFHMQGPGAAPLSALFSRFCQDIGVPEDRVTFLDPDGEVIDPRCTAAEASLEPDDLIEAHVRNNT